MTLEDIAKIKCYQSRAIAEIMQRDEQTALFIIACYQDYLRGNYGVICEEDKQANDKELAEGYGHILARNEARFALPNDIYIETHFDKDMPLDEIDYNNTLIMLTEER